MPAGTVHALGPGLLIYEVQQTSDITYRLYDWDRPQTASRVLHIEKSLAVADPTITGYAAPSPMLQDGDCQVLCRSDYFTLEILGSVTRTLEGDTQAEAFHALTVTSGSLRLAAQDEEMTLNSFDSVIIPADAGPYRMEPLGGFRILRASP
jgi:mannose-6-phosphate isomerase